MKKYQKLLDLGMRDVTTNAQEKHGTRAFAIDTNEGTLVYAIYASGYVRSINRGYTCYQLNPIRRVDTIHQVVDAETGEVLYTLPWRRWRRNVRVLIKTERERIDFLYNYIKKNFVQTYVSKRNINKYRGKNYK